MTYDLTWSQVVFVIAGAILTGWMWQVGWHAQAIALMAGDLNLLVARQMVQMRIRRGRKYPPAHIPTDELIDMLKVDVE